MWLNPFPVIWWSERAYIELPGDGLHTLDRLRMRLLGWHPRTWMEEGCRGRIKRDRVKLQRYRPLRRRGSEIVLDARVSEMGGKSVVVGEYRNSWLARFFDTLWFGMAIVFIPLFLYGAAKTWEQDQWSAVVIGMVPPALFMFGRGIQALGASHREDDKQYIEQFILDASLGKK